MIVRQLVIDVAAETIRLLRRVDVVMRDVAKNAIRAAGAAVAQTLEALGRTGRDRVNRLRCAYGEVLEAAGLLELLMKTGDLEQRNVAPLLVRWDRVAGMLWGLRRRG